MGLARENNGVGAAFLTQHSFEESSRHTGICTGAAAPTETRDFRMCKASNAANISPFIQEDNKNLMPPCAVCILRPTCNLQRFSQADASRGLLATATDECTHSRAGHVARSRCSGDLSRRNLGRIIYPPLVDATLSLLGNTSEPSAPQNLSGPPAASCSLLFPSTISCQHTFWMICVL